MHKVDRAFLRHTHPSIKDQGSIPILCYKEGGNRLYTTRVALIKNSEMLRVTANFSSIEQ